MKLQILIPQYNEDEETIRPLLSSIALQQNVDLSEIGVIIANDGGDVILGEEFLGSFPYQITYIQCEHRGVSAARNACLDNADAEYIMFCDADDMFYNLCGLYIIFREMQGDGFDALTSLFIEETRNPETKKPLYINRESDTTFVHGKVYRLAYLIENGIRWKDRLTVHEDSYFNCLAIKCAKTAKYSSQPFYLWRWRDASVCRHDPKYLLKTYRNMLESSTALVRELLSRGRVGDAQTFATGMIYDAYYTLNKKEWLDQENQSFRHATELRFKSYVMEFKALFNDIPMEARGQIIVNAKNRAFKEGVFLEVITFDDWIRHILDMEENDG